MRDIGERALCRGDDTPTVAQRTEPGFGPPV
jgi:hypothetical protein